MISKWPNAQLDDLVEEIIDRRGITPLKLGSEFTSYGHRVISAKLIKNDRVELDADEPRFVDEATYRRWMGSPLKADDVILTSEAPLGETAYIRETLDWCLGQRLFAIRTRSDRLLGRFLFYAFKYGPVRNDLLSRATGTTAQGIRQAELRRVRVPVPPLPEQRAIAHVLGTLDDKIELNRRMNQTLEEIARALFHSWFVAFDPVRAKAAGGQPAGMDAATAARFPDAFAATEHGEIPAGWRIETLGEIVANPRQQVSPQQIDPDVPYIGLEHMPRRSSSLSEWSTGEGINSGKFAFAKGDILFGKLRPYFHKVGVAPVDGICSTDILVLRAKSAVWFGFALGHLSSDDLVEFADRGSQGTRMPRTSWKQLAEYHIALPPEPIGRKFANLMGEMVDGMIASIHQTRTLAALRDTLLPKLLSGEIRVSEAEEVSAQAVGVTA